ncbi:MAG TPA: HD domain-containing phosphohydrolase [Burkholderiaceae bacterium]|nr:HD domain-containing phosphohydrolase [Burkholderiaceae bacterium]
MKLAAIRADLVQVGAPIPFDVYNSTGRLLLRRGHVVESEQQLERLVQSGRYDPDSADAATQRLAARAPRVVQEFSRLPSQTARNRVSIFDRLTEATHTLEDAFSLQAPAPEYESMVRSAAVSVRESCALDSDAALAHILIAGVPRYSLRHTTNVAVLTSLLLSRLNHDPAKAESTIAAALTMNLCILDLQDTLVRQQEPLTSEQRSALRLHAAESAKALRSRAIQDPTWLNAVEQHHEARDGSGYPAGLKEPDICREAQIVSVADRYCSLVSQRTYRPALSPRRAIKELHERAGGAIEPGLIGALIATVGLFPPGAYVRLANGETAIVVRRLLDPKHPVVYALHQDTTAPYETPKKRLTATHRDYEITSDVKPEAVRVKIVPDELWPPSAVGEAPPA